MGGKWCCMSSNIIMLIKTTWWPFFTLFGRKGWVWHWTWHCPLWPSFNMAATNFACVCLPLWANHSALAWTQTNTLRRMFVPCLCHCGQTHRFRHCLSAAVAAVEYPKKNTRNGNKKELYFLLYFNKWNLHSIYLLHTVSDGKCI